MTAQKTSNPEPDYFLLSAISGLSGLVAELDGIDLSGLPPTASQQVEESLSGIREKCYDLLARVTPKEKEKEKGTEIEQVEEI